MSKQHCTICAWRETCNKRFSVSDGGSRCPDFSRDVSIKLPQEENKTNIEKNGSAKS